ncbi:universal stress protein [Actinomycetospora endophytica]|uniref:Universal stress protein n=1 Tax=Actinomycetospora endophytica TaxID=2291215 RepID=A0ABS8PJ34_9PSEU|nr:universal stress protein [Actinomycetospora endophytica]MCD2198237.1 universal stress protein [Actinomycetospora endophytica]
MSPPRLIAVGTDGSASSHIAVERAGQLALDQHAGLLIVCAYRDQEPETINDAEAALGADAYLMRGAAPAEEIAARARSRVDELGVEHIELVVEEGDPAEVLAGVAQRRGVSLVAVGNRGINTLAGRLLGSVPAKASHQVPVDLLIVHTT